MDLYMVILRILHIGAGILWVGFAVFMLYFGSPAARSMQDRGLRYTHALLSVTPFSTVMSTVALVTVIAGFLLYLRVSGTFNSAWLTSPGGIVLTIGSVAGLLAAGHGFTGIRGALLNQKAIVNAVIAQSGPPTPEQAAQLQAAGQRMGRNSQIGVILMIIAVLGMASARYL